jgi:hypothetical protein
VVAVSAPVDFELAVAWLPLQPPEAVHAVALVEDQTNVELVPLATLVGLALKETVGRVAGGGVTDCTVTVVDRDVDPPVPVHVSVNWVVVARAVVVCEPLVGWTPLQPPDAMQLCALVALQSKITERPLATVLALGARATLGAELLGGEVLGGELEEFGLTDDCPQAAKAASIEKASTQCSPRAGASSCRGCRPPSIRLSRVALIADTGVERQ